jgi:hypothetical protein
MKSTIELYHWKTKSYSVHKACGEIYEKLGHNIDRFVEVLMGKCKNRIRIVEKKIILHNIENIESMKNKIVEYRNDLISIDHFLDKKDTDLLSIRDEILADINQFLYFLSFDK